MNAEFTAHFFFTMLPYRITRPGTLCMPTSVAEIICHALSPLFSQDGTPRPGEYPAVMLYAVGSSDIFEA
jgi:hypothetical protein